MDAGFTQRYAKVRPSLANEFNCKGQLISKCLFGVIVWTKIAMIL